MKERVWVVDICGYAAEDVLELDRQLVEQMQEGGICGTLVCGCHDAYAVEDFQLDRFLEFWPRHHYPCGCRICLYRQRREEEAKAFQ